LIEIPTAMDNLMDSYPGEVEESLPEIRKGEGLYGEIKNQMKHSSWMPQAIVQLGEDANTDVTNNGTIRQRSHGHSLLLLTRMGLTMFHSMAQSTPAMHHNAQHESPKDIDFGFGDNDDINPRAYLPPVL
jgi:hypothetical protein